MQSEKEEVAIYLYLHTFTRAEGLQISYLPVNLHLKIMVS